MKLAARRSAARALALAMAARAAVALAQGIPADLRTRLRPASQSTRPGDRPTRRAQLDRRQGPDYFWYSRERQGRQRNHAGGRHHGGSKKLAFDHDKLATCGEHRYRRPLYRHEPCPSRRPLVDVAVRGGGRRRCGRSRAH